MGALVRRTPVTCDPETPVADAAGLMARERVSSLLVPNASEGGVGILTDRDLRTRVVAERRSGETPVREVMTPRAETVPPDTMVGEVLLRMLEGGFHHFPIAAADGSVLGVVTDTDLMGIGRDTPFALKSSIERAPDREAVATAVGELPRVVSTLVSASADPVDVGHVIAFSIDAATRRLLELGMAEHGEPPFPWAWLALGSAARQEQAIRTDQDHALAFEGDPDAAERVVGPARRVRHRRARGRRDLPLHGQRDGDERRAPPLPAAVGRAVRVLDEPGVAEGERTAVDRLRLPQGRRGRWTPTSRSTA